MNEISRCRICGSLNLETVLDLGEQYIADFRPDDSKPPRYPLEMVLCKNCMLVQLRHTAPAKELYTENYGFKSGVSNTIKADLQSIVNYSIKLKKGALHKWLDIASNDGTLLSYVSPYIYRVGVDPIKKLCTEAEQHADRIHNEFFTPNRFNKYEFDVVTSISCFYDMDDPNKFVTGVKAVMATDGLWVIQQNYLPEMMKLGAVDNTSHEHLEYYTFLSLENLLRKHDLEVIHVELNDTNGGSMRTAVAHAGRYEQDESVMYLRQEEHDQDLIYPDTYSDFAYNSKYRLKVLSDQVVSLKMQKKRIAILAASTRGSTIWQSAGIDEKYVDYAVERNPDKVGKYYSPIGIPIFSEEFARDDKPDVMLVGPWFFRDEIVEREKEFVSNGGKLIFPLPKLEVIG